jgi:hypothetical protein
LAASFLLNCVRVSAARMYASSSSRSIVGSSTGGSRDRGGRRAAAGSGSVRLRRPQRHHDAGRRGHARPIGVSAPMALARGLIGRGNSQGEGPIHVRTSAPFRSPGPHVVRDPRPCAGSGC